jgi:hypothetical protein
MHAAILCLTCIFADNLSAQTQPHGIGSVDSSYHSKLYRDSVNSYIGRKLAYEQQLLSYDDGFALSLLPYAGGWYVEEPGRSLAFLGARLGAGALATVGVISLFNPGNDIRDGGLVLLGVAAYALFKYLEVDANLHSISYRNEEMALKYGIAEEDLRPHSIRYPRNPKWPEWVTEPPEKRNTQRARPIFDEPIPKVNKLIGFGITFPF